jgi:hypothetical protein
LTFALEKLNASDPTNNRLRERDRQDFLLEESGNPEPVLFQLDLLPFVPADRQNDALDGNQFLITLVFRDKRFCYHTGDFRVEFRGGAFP